MTNNNNSNNKVSSDPTGGLACLEYASKGNITDK